MGSLNSKESAPTSHAHQAACIGHFSSCPISPQPFDTNRSRPDRGTSSRGSGFTLNGLLLYAEGVAKDRQLVWFDRIGGNQTVPGEDAYSVSLSPDGKSSPTISMELGLMSGALISRAA
jgi:hypothetical protein